LRQANDTIFKSSQPSRNREICVSPEVRARRGRAESETELAAVCAIGGVQFAPVIQLIAVLLEMIEQISLALTGKLQ